MTGLASASYSVRVDLIKKMHEEYGNVSPTPYAMQKMGKVLDVVVAEVLGPVTQEEAKRAQNEKWTPMLVVPALRPFSRYFVVGRPVTYNSDLLPLKVSDLRTYPPKRRWYLP